VTIVRAVDFFSCVRQDTRFTISDLPGEIFTARTTIYAGRAPDAVPGPIIGVRDDNGDYWQVTLADNVDNEFTILS